MPANSNQIDELQNAADYLAARQQEVMPNYRLQQITVHILNDPVNEPDGAYAEVRFQWVGDHYDFTVS